MSDTAYPSVNDLTLEEKASLTSGGDAWHLQGVETKGIPGYMITDGPHGLRKSLASSTGETDLNDSVPATCFPPAAGLSSSWNPELIHKVGEAMAEECIQEKVAVILGPGVNIKRNPLGGRCFEYWSEDPYLAGHEAVGIVAGVQSKGVGTSLKHFAANNQETDRQRISANISQRALREIYFPAFEHIVKEAQPATLMCSYNRLNGTLNSQNQRLLPEILRKFLFVHPFLELNVNQIRGKRLPRNFLAYLHGHKKGGKSRAGHAARPHNDAGGGLGLLDDAHNLYVVHMRSHAHVHDGSHSRAEIFGASAAQYPLHS